MTQLRALTGTALDAALDGRLSWSSESNRVYTLEKTTNLIGGAWTTVTNDLPATPPMNTYTDQVPVGAQGYYRIRVSP